MAVCQDLVPLVNINIAGKWMFIPLKMVLIGIDPYPDGFVQEQTIPGTKLPQDDVKNHATPCEKRGLSRGIKHVGHTIDVAAESAKDINQFQ